MQVPRAVKNPRVIIGVLFALWLFYFFYANVDQAAAIWIFPFVAQLVVRLWALVIAAMVLGAALTLLAQGLWRRRQASKLASSSSTDSGVSTNTST